MGPQLMLRPATPADVPAIVDLVNAHALEVVGTRRALIDDAGKPGLPATSRTAPSNGWRRQGAAPSSPSCISARISAR